MRFVRTETGLVDARTALEDAIRAGINGEAVPVTATRVWRGEAVPAVVEIEEVEERAENGLGFLDMLAETEESLPELGRVMGEITAVFNELAVLGETAQDEMRHINERGGGAGGQLRVALEVWRSAWKCRQPG